MPNPLAATGRAWRGDCMVLLTVDAWRAADA
jgi:hypothetical protein